MKNVIIQKLILPVAIVGLSLPLIFSFFHKGYFPTHDGEWAVVRLSDMYREVKEGQIPPRWSGNLNSGFGYPLFNFAYPMPYYLGIPFVVMQLGFVTSIKILFALSVPASGLGMFLVARQIWGSSGAGLMSAVLYMYFPYRAVDLYVRGSLGESLASVLFPFILYFVIRLYQKTRVWEVIGLAVSFGALVLTHNIMAVLFSFVIGGFVIGAFIFGKRKEILGIFWGILGGALLSMYFWLPALVEKKYILLSRIPIADRDLYYVKLSDLIYSPWGYGSPTDPDPFTYQLGLPQIALTLGVTVGCILFSRKVIPGRHYIYTIGVLIVFFMVMLFPLSKPIWESVPLLKEINFPWTNLLPLGFLMSLLGGCVYVLKRAGKMIVGIFAVVAIVSVTQMSRPSVFVDRGDAFYLTNDATTTSSKELMPLWVKDMPLARPEKKAEIISGEGVLADISSASHRLTFTSSLATPATIRVNTIYYPGWKWYSNDEEVVISYKNDKGVMEAHVDAGESHNRLVFTETPLRLASDYVSLVTILLLGALVVSPSLRRRIEKKFL